MGEIVRAREIATNARQYFVANLIFQAVFEKDMGLIDIIATRIDGTVPVTKERESFANLLGDAIDDVLDMERAEQTMINPDDTAIIAIAKIIYHIGVDSAGKDVNKRRDRQKAVEMIYARTAGRRNEPVRIDVEDRYVKPNWLENISSTVEECDTISDAAEENPSTQTV